MGAYPSYKGSPFLRMNVGKDKKSPLEKALFQRTKFLCFFRKVHHSVTANTFAKFITLSKRKKSLELTRLFDLLDGCF